MAHPLFDAIWNPTAGSALDNRFREKSHPKNQKYHWNVTADRRVPNPDCRTLCGSNDIDLQLCFQNSSVNT